MTWKILGQGSYQRVFYNQDQTRVRKIRITQPDAIDYEYDAPERSVRLWNLLNADVPGPATIAKTSKGELCWTCPYIRGQQASDTEIQNLLISIYAKHRRIIPDASVKGNVLTTPSGTTHCVDVGSALLLGPAASPVSQRFWNHLQPRYLKFFKHPELQRSPKSLATIKALLYINAQGIPFNAEFRANIPKYAAAFHPLPTKPTLRTIAKQGFFHSPPPPSPWTQLLKLVFSPIVILQYGVAFAIKALKTISSAVCNALTIQPGLRANY